MSEYVDRRGRLTTILQQRGIAGALITNLVNIRYLTGFTGSNAAVLLNADGVGLLLTDGRYQDQAAVEVPDLERHITRDLLDVAAARMCAGDWAIETHVLSIDAHATLTRAAPEVRTVSLERAVESLRMIKDESEVDALRRACEISTVALAGLIDGPLRGRTEREIAHDLERRMFELGAEAIAFDTILAAGENAAIPHHSPADRIVQTGDLLKIDFGARVEGYHADCTRTFVIGTAADWQREIHDVVRVAQQAGLDQLTAGTPVSDSLTAVRQVLDDAGWLASFTTGLGHGVGLEIHEDPFIAAQGVGKIDPCTVMTMEPGIYLPGRGGVRIEDTVVVTSGAPEVLTTMTKELMELA